MLLAGVLGCTAFILGQGEGAIVAKSYDWQLGDAMVLVNKRGVAKHALTTDGSRGAEWVSRYGSLTFNQYGREMPNGGMNEAGLVVEVLWLDETRYARPDERPAVSELQWIQMQLDLHATAAEVAASAGKVRIFSDSARVHYLVCDRGGACVAVEVLDGKVVASRGARALTNHTYAASMTRLAQSAAEPVPTSASSLDRFVRASRLARGGVSVGRAFEILASVAQGDHSKWNIVYEPSRGRVSWRTLAEKRVRSVELSAFDLSCGAPVMMVDVDEPAPRWRPYEREANRRLIAKSFADMGVPQALAALVTRYPESLACTR